MNPNPNPPVASGDNEFDELIVPTIPLTPEELLQKQKSEVQARENLAKVKKLYVTKKGVQLTEKDTLSRIKMSEDAKKRRNKKTKEIKVSKWNKLDVERTNVRKDNALSKLAERSHVDSLGSHDTYVRAEEAHRITPAESLEIANVEEKRKRKEQRDNASIKKAAAAGDIKSSKYTREKPPKEKASTYYTEEERSAFKKACRLEKKIKKRVKKTRQAKQRAEIECKSSTVNTESLLVHDGESVLYSVAIKALTSAGCYALSQKCLEGHEWIFHTLAFAYAMMKSDSSHQDMIIIWDYLLKMDISKARKDTKWVESIQAHLRSGDITSGLSEKFKRLSKQSLDETERKKNEKEEETLEFRKRRRPPPKGHLYPFKGSDVMMSIKQWESVRSKSNTTIPNTESKVTDFLDDVRSYQDMVLNSSMVKTFRDVILGIVSWKFFDKDVAGYIAAVLGKPVRLTLPDFFSYILKCISDMLKMIESFYLTGSVSKFFLSEDPILASTVEADYLSSMQDRIYYGIPVDNHLECDSWLVRARDTQGAMNKLSTNISPISPNGIRLTYCLQKIGESITHVTELQAGVRRQTPIAVCINGPPEIGKSVVTQIIHKIYCDIKQIPYQTSMIFAKNCYTEYWEGYDANRTPIVHISEGGSLARTLAVKLGDTAVFELTSLIDSLPHNLNMAGVDLKAKVKFKAGLITIDTNNDHLNAKYTVDNPAAVLRRFLFIIPKVLEKYRDPATLTMRKGIDDGNFSDRWMYDIYTQKAINKSESEPFSLGTNLSGKEAYVVIEKYMRDHIRNEERLVELSRDLDISCLRPDVNEQKLPEFSPTVEVDETWVLPDAWEEGSDEWLETDSLIDEKENYAMNSNGTFVYSGAKTESRLMGACDSSVDKVKNTVDQLVMRTIPLIAAFAIKIVNMNAWNFIAACGLSIMWLVMSMIIHFRKIPVLVGFAMLFYLPIATAVTGIIFIYLFMEFVFLSPASDMTKVVLEHRFHCWITLLKIYSNAKTSVERVRQFAYGNYVPILYCSGAVAAAIGAVCVVKKLYDEKKEQLDAITEASEFSRDSIVTKEFNEMETNYNCTDSYVRVPVKGTKIWNNCLKPLSKSLHTSDISHLCKMVERNQRRCIVSNGGNPFETYILGIKGNLALINLHAIKGPNACALLEISSNGGLDMQSMIQSHNILLSEAIKVADDIVVVQLKGQNFTDITKHFPDMLGKFDNAKGFINGDPIVACTLDAPMLVNDRIVDGRQQTLVFSDPIVYDWEQHAPGKCGKAVIAKRDSGSCIVGIHSAGDAEDHKSYAVQVDRNRLLQACGRFSMEGFNIYSAVSESRLANRGLYGVEPHPKSPVRYEYMGDTRYFGRIEQALVNGKSRLKKTVFNVDGRLDEMFYENCAFIQAEDHVKPLMGPRGSGLKFASPYNTFMRGFDKKKPVLDSVILTRCVDEYSKHIIDGVFSAGFSETLQPLMVETVLNGSQIDKLVRRMDVSKSAGFATPGPKIDYVNRLDLSDGKVKDEFVDDVLSQILSIVDCYTDGKRSGIVYKGSLKDEAVKASKVVLGKTRMFFAGPLAELTLAKMFLGPVYALMIEYGFIFGTSIGVDMHRDADVLYKRVTEKFSNFMAGDWGGFDKSMPYGFGHAAAEVTHNICVAFGYTPEQVAIVDGILSDNLHPFVLILGELFEFSGLQPSGMYGTAENNTKRNVLMMMYAFYRQPANDERDFFQHVCVNTYGDDIINSVSDEAGDDFNNMVLERVARDEYFMTYTNADKTAILVPFNLLEDIDYLKRKFVYDPRYCRVMAPLSLKSIHRSLQWHIPSAYVNSPTQLESICTSALIELSLHLGRQKFNFMRDEMLTILKFQYEGCVFNLPTYEYIFKSLSIDEDTIISDYKDVRAEEEVHVDTESRLLNRHDLSPVKSALSKGLSRPLEQYNWLASEIKEEEPTLVRGRNQVLDLSELDNLIIEAERDYLPFETYCNRPRKDVLQDIRYQLRADFRELIDKAYAFKSHLQALKLTRAHITRERRVTVFSESNEMCDKGDNATMDKFENLEDMSGAPAAVIYEEESKDIDAGQKNYLDLTDFFERPIRIAAISVVVGSHLTYAVDIWEVWLSDASIRAKFRNFAFFRANLKIRISISATPFHYGQILVSYQPLAAVNANLPVMSGGLATFRTQALTYFSQSPEVAVMDVRDNEPLEMMLPYISPSPMIRLFNESPLILPDTTPLEDSVGFGKVYINSINVIKCASATPSDISVFVYAWAENVELGTPTGTVITVGTESRAFTESKEVDERVSGPVERFFSGASKYLGYLSVVPALAPFAKASSMASSALGAVASLFGFSTPTMNTEPMRVKNQPFQNGCQMIGYDTGKRITMDPKQELSIDPRALAVSEDHMHLSALTSRKSLLDVFPWTAATVPLGSSIWTVPVSPMLMKRYAYGPDYLYVPTALAFAATPFGSWRGDIIFEFRIVCSNYHRGKLAFYFEPNISQTVVIDTELDLNKQYVKVIDLQETQSVSFRVEWAHVRAWARMMNPTTLLDLGSVGYAGTALAEYANGYVGVTPLTTLQSPDSSDVEINVFIYSDNMHFNELSANIMPTKRPTVESRPMEEAISLNSSSATTDGLCELHYGEKPISFRGLLKRFVGNRSVLLISDVAPLAYQLAFTPRMYPSPAPAYDGVDATYAERGSLFRYLRYAYVGMRGGIRRRVGLLGDSVCPEVGRTKVSRAYPTTFEVAEGFKSSYSYTYLNSLLRGSVEFVTQTNAGIEFETPMYTRNLFAISFSDDPYPASFTPVDTLVSRALIVSFPVTSYTAAKTYVCEDIATAEDFSFMRYQGAPAYLL